MPTRACSAVFLDAQAAFTLFVPVLCLNKRTIWLSIRTDKMIVIRIEVAVSALWTKPAFFEQEEGLKVAVDSPHMLT
jgi:hypothetical protein